MPCFGYSVSLHRTGKFDLERATALGLSRTYWSRLQKGEAVVYEGKTFTPDMVLGGDRKGLKLSYITDTRPVNTIPAFIQGSDLFICEGLYGEDDKLEKVRDHRHMLFSEAAALAKNGGVSELWLTHFSPAMPNPEQFIDAARTIFPNATAGRDRMTKTLLFKE
jgi:ribonuclease Z